MNIRFWKFAIVYTFRNLFRHKRRSILIFLTILSSVAISIVAVSYSDGVMRLWKDGAADTGTAHVQIFNKKYIRSKINLDQNSLISEDNPYLKELALDKDVAAFVKRLSFEGLIVTDEKSSYFIAQAVDAEAELKVSPRLFHPRWDQGAFINGTHESSVAIGRGISRILGLKIGDGASLLARTAAGSANAVDIEVVGIIDVPLPGFSKRTIYLNLAHAQRLLRMPGYFSHIAVRLYPHVTIKDWVRKHQDQAQQFGLVLRPWWEIEPVINKIELIWNSVAGILVGLLLLSSGLTVLNVIYMMVNERTTEIGTLMALGATPRVVRFLFSLEGLLIGLMAGFLGMFVGNVVVFVLNQQGIDFESPFGSGIEVVHPAISGWFSLISLMVTAVGCMAMAWPPARKASKVNPVVAFRNQL